MLISDGRRPRPTSKKNRRLVLAAASQEGVPRSEILLDLSFSHRSRYVQMCFIARKEVIIFYGYTYIWILKLH